MARTRMVATLDNPEGVEILLTQDEEDARDTEVAEWDAGAANRTAAKETVRIRQEITDSLTDILDMDETGRAARIAAIKAGTGTRGNS